MIRIFLSLLYASESDLGWDPSISTSLVDGERVHTIDVSGIRVQTDESMALSLQRSKMILGSGARIYKAHKIIDEKRAELLVLKDYWIEDGKIPECLIREQILRDIEDENDREYVDEHILTPLAYGRVKVGDIDDHTEMMMLGEKSLDLSERIDSLTPVEVVSEKMMIGSENESNDTKSQISRAREDNQEKRDVNRYHYRILYKEVATPFYNLKNSMDIILVSIDVLESKYYNFWNT